ncbi:hypothetical protein GGX14DRAFT_400503 [Mycena pura]|uniref:Uncharacterized protein n=1 Tax=Mycena pura TaxID=153505 RepID=A0AAD6YBB5_9AGAR|nr:hypothetical protein GGX14DRAFT_400503 [Mycena pura]
MLFVYKSLPGIERALHTGAQTLSNLERRAGRLVWTQTAGAERVLSERTRLLRDMLEGLCGCRQRARRGLFQYNHAHENGLGRSVHAARWEAVACRTKQFLYLNTATFSTATLVAGYGNCLFLHATPSQYFSDELFAFGRKLDEKIKRYQYLANFPDESRLILKVLFSVPVNLKHVHTVFDAACARVRCVSGSLSLSECTRACMCSVKDGARALRDTVPCTSNTRTPSLTRHMHTRAGIHKTARARSIKGGARAPACAAWTQRQSTRTHACGVKDMDARARSIFFLERAHADAERGPRRLARTLTARAERALRGH